LSQHVFDTEICVVGAGPAGAAFAMRMASLGHRVLLVERSDIPRPQIGEALTPGIWPLLDALGVVQAIRSADFLPVREAVIRWAERSPERLSRPLAQAGLTVDRGRFDLLLQNAARSAGATIWRRALAGRPRKTASGWTLGIRTDDGIRTVHADYLADASGRSRVIGSSPARRLIPTIALQACWRGEAEPGKPTHLEAGRFGWCWGLHLPDGAYRAFVFLDTAVARQSHATRNTLEKLYRELLASTHILDGLGDPRQVSRVTACDATCYSDPEPVTTSSILLGDASCAIDPLSSSGVQKALQSALAGAATVHTLRQAGGDWSAAMTFYRDSQRQTFDRHMQWSGGYYSGARRFARDPFWRIRTRPVTVSESLAPLKLQDALPRRARLARDARLLLIPCIVGNQVARRRALAHPTLPRPVAYLGDTELAPMLDTIERYPTLAEAILQWSHDVSAAKCLEVVHWLNTRGLLKSV
jgi:flavin-dependent dehydrogenase